MGAFGQTDGMEPNEDVIVIHLGHLSESEYDTVLKSVIAFMNTRWPNVAQIGRDS